MKNLPKKSKQFLDTYALLWRTSNVRTAVIHFGFGSLYRVRYCAWRMWICNACVYRRCWNCLRSSFFYTHTLALKLFIFFLIVMCHRNKQLNAHYLLKHRQCSMWKKFFFAPHLFNGSLRKERTVSILIRSLSIQTITAFSSQQWKTYSSLFSSFFFSFVFRKKCEKDEIIYLWKKNINASIVVVEVFVGNVMKITLAANKSLNYVKWFIRDFLWWVIKIIIDKILFFTFPKRKPVPIVMWFPTLNDLMCSIKNGLCCVHYVLFSMIT